MTDGDVDATGRGDAARPDGDDQHATPSFSWTAVSGATHYLLFVKDASTGAKINVTYTAAAVGCGAGTGTCTDQPGCVLGPRHRDLVDPDVECRRERLVEHTLQLRSCRGRRRRRRPRRRCSRRAGTISTATPSFSWTAVSGATHYQLWVNDASTAAKIYVMYTAAAVGCGAGTGTCTISPGVSLAPGNATWWIRTSNAAGPGPWSTAFTASVSTPSTRPGAATLLAPSGTVATTTPSFSWAAVSGATHYQLWVNDASAGGKINVTYTAAAVGCGAGTGTCTISPGVTLAPGTATWWILTSNAAGAGPWSLSLAFLLPAPTSTYGPTPAITCPVGAYDLWPGSNIPFLISFQPAGTTYCLRAGVHAITGAITPKRGDTFVGEFGAILDGSGWSTSDDTQAAFRAHNQDIDYVTIRNLVIRNMPQRGIHAYYYMADHWTIEYNEIAHTRYTGLVFPGDSIIRNNYIHHSQFAGYMGPYAHNTVVEGNEIAYNGGQNKIAETRNVTFRNNFVHHNAGTGIWYDSNNTGSVVEGNRVEDNGLIGIFYEISSDGIIRNNTIRRNADAGVMLSVTRDMQIYNNTFDSNFRAITYFLNCPSLAQSTSFDLANNAAYDNTIIVGTRSGALAGVFSYASCTSTQVAPYLNGSKNLTFSRNAYSVPSVNGWYWLWDGLRYWGMWQSLGQDLNSTVSQ